MLDKAYRPYVLVLLCIGCIAVSIFQGIRTYVEGLALKDSSLRQTLEYRRLNSFQPSLTRKNILEQEAHIQHLEQWIDHHLSRSPDSLCIQNLSANTYSGSLDAYATALKADLVAHAIALGSDLELEIQPLISLESEQSTRKQLEAISQAFDCLLSAQPQSIISLKTYDHAAFKKKSFLSQEAYFVDQRPISYFKIKFCGYSESLRTFICLLNKKSYAFLIDRVRVKAKNSFVDSQHGFLNCIPGSSEFTLWIAALDSFYSKGEGL